MVDHFHNIMQLRSDLIALQVSTVFEEDRVYEDETEFLNTLFETVLKCHALHKTHFGRDEEECMSHEMCQWDLKHGCFGDIEDVCYIVYNDDTFQILFTGDVIHEKKDTLMEEEYERYMKRHTKILNKMCRDKLYHDYTVSLEYDDNNGVMRVKLE